MASKLKQLCKTFVLEVGMLLAWHCCHLL